MKKSHKNMGPSKRTSLIRWQVDTNKTWNRQICNQFDEMATKLGEIPDKTKELVELQRYKLIPYDSLISYHIQIGMGSPKRHLFDRQFCVGLLQTFCKQWPKGPGKIPKFRPLHSVRQNVVGFRRGLFTCFLGHTP